MQPNAKGMLNIGLFLFFKTAKDLHGIFPVSLSDKHLQGNDKDVNPCDASQVKLCSDSSNLLVRNY